MVKKISALILALALSLSLFACGARDYFGHAELRIALSEDFKEFEAESFDAAYTDGSAVVGIIRISFEAGFNNGIPDFLTPRQFASVYMKGSGRECEIKTFHGVPYYEYEETLGGARQGYLASFFRSRYAYFAVIFAADESIYSSLVPEFLDYTDTLVFEY